MNQIVLFIAGQYVLFNVVPSVAGYTLQAIASWAWHRWIWRTKVPPTYKEVLILEQMEDETVVKKFESNPYTSEQMLVLE